MRKSSNIHNEVKKYLAHLQFERNLSSNTLDSYWLDLKAYIEYMIDIYKVKKLNDIKKKHISKYISYLQTYLDYNKDVKKKKTSSINRSISSIKNFYKYLNNNDIIKDNPTKILTSGKQEKKLPDILTVEEIDLILNSFNLSKKNNVRDKAIIALLYSCGLRVSELISLRLTNLFFDQEIIRVFGKGSKERIVPIGAIAKEELMNYINEIRPEYTRNIDSKGLLFLSNRGKELSRKSVWNIIKLSVERSGVNKKVSPHTFRHSFACHLLEGGAGLRVVQELLGHSNISTTQIYTQLDQSYLIEVFKQYHPRS